MTVTISSFRQTFPAFTDTATYTDAMITFWLDIANKALNVRRWGTLLDLGLSLYVAHNLVLEKQAGEAAAGGGDPGSSSGVISSESVDKASIAFDTARGTEEDAGHWNLTTYGTRFLRYSRMAGAGGIQVGPCCG